MDQPIAEEALEKLATLVGDWTLEAMSADGEPWPAEVEPPSNGMIPGHT